MDMITMPEWEDQQLNTKMGVTVLEESTAQRVVGTMPVDGNRQPYGLLHGGASCVLAETLASVGSALHALPDKTSAGLELNATHLRSAVAGILTGVATPVHLGGTIATYQVLITDSDDHTICIARVTCVLRPVAGLMSRATKG
jgi:uncharacterized protein (TIGR00369 family)